MGEPAVYTRDQVREIIERAQRIREAVEDDERNPVASPYLERIDFLRASIPTHPSSASQMINVMQDAIVALVGELDTIALVLTQALEDDKSLAAETSARRLRRVVELEAELDAAHKSIAAREEIAQRLERLLAAADVELEGAQEAIKAAHLKDERGAIEGVRAAIAGSKRAPLAVPRTRTIAGEVLPPEQRASWARERTEHDTPPARFEPHPNCPSPSGRKA